MLRSDKGIHTGKMRCEQDGLSPTEKAGAISILHSSLSNMPLANAFLAFSSAYPQRSTS